MNAFITLTSETGVSFICNLNKVLYFSEDVFGHVFARFDNESVGVVESLQEIHNIVNKTS